MNPSPDFYPGTSLVIVALIVVVLAGVLPQVIKRRHDQLAEREATAESDTARRLPVHPAGKASRSHHAGRRPRLLTGEIVAGAAPDANLLRTPLQLSQASQLAVAQSRTARRLRAVAMLVLFLTTVALVPFAVLQLTPMVTPLVPAAALVALVVAMRKADVKQRSRMRQAYALQRLVADTQRAHFEAQERETRLALDRSAAAAAATVAGAVTGAQPKARRAKPTVNELSGPLLLQQRAREAAISAVGPVPAAVVNAEVVTAVVADAGSTWSPTPVPRPTYVIRAEAQAAARAQARVLKATDSAAVAVQRAQDQREVSAQPLPRVHASDEFAAGDSGAAGDTVAQPTAALSVTSLLAQRRANAS